MHEYQIKEKEVTTLQMGLKEMSDYEIKFKNSLVDIGNKFNSFKIS